MRRGKLLKQRLISNAQVLINLFLMVYQISMMLTSPIICFSNINPGQRLMQHVYRHTYMCVAKISEVTFILLEYFATICSDVKILITPGVTDF
jgi:hypothetical protein